MSVIPVDEGTSSSDGLNNDNGESTAQQVEPSPVNSIIRPQLWVHWTITALCVVAWAGMLFFGDLAERTDFGLRDIVGIRSGRLTTFFSTIMLLWAGQLSLLIYWYRRKSRNDYHGRYRMWLWIGGMLQVFLAIAATKAHEPFSAYIQRTVPVDVPMYGLLCWLVPISTMSLALYQMLHIELRRHRSGRTLLLAAGLAGMVAAASLLGGRFLPERSLDLIQIGSITFAHLALATALLMHARYVVHVCNEAPAKSKKRRLMNAARSAAGYLPTMKLPKLKLPKPSLSKISLPTLSLPRPKLPSLPLPKWPTLRRSQPSTADASSAEKDSAETPQKSTQNGGKKTVDTKSATVTARKQKPKVQLPRQRIDEPVTSSAPSPSATASFDDILDRFSEGEEIAPEDLRGLTKKQRRRLKKKQRELQRA